MDVVRDLIPADGAHIRIEPLSFAEAVFFQCIALPFGQGLHHLRFIFVLLLNAEGNRPLDAVQVVVHAGSRIHEQRRGYAQQVQPFSQQPLKEILHRLDPYLGIVQGQGGFIIFRNFQMFHICLFYLFFHVIRRRIRPEGCLPRYLY